MPVYCESFLVSGGDPSLQIHVFDYVNTRTESERNQAKSTKQLISLYPCIFLGTKNLAQLDDSGREVALKRGKTFEGYFIRTKNGTYDYCYKIWTNRRLPVSIFIPLLKDYL